MCSQSVLRSCAAGKTSCSCCSATWKQSIGSPELLWVAAFYAPNVLDWISHRTECSISSSSSLPLICTTSSACCPTIQSCWIIDALFIDLWRASSQPSFILLRATRSSACLFLRLHGHIFSSGFQWVLPPKPGPVRRLTVCPHVSLRLTLGQAFRCRIAWGKISSDPSSDLSSFQSVYCKRCFTPDVPTFAPQVFVFETL